MNIVLNNFSFCMYEVISQYRFAYTSGFHLKEFTKIGGQNDISIDKKSVITFAFLIFSYYTFFEHAWRRIFPMSFPLYLLYLQFPLLT